jgi:hypothetical protein
MRSGVLFVIAATAAVWAARAEASPEADAARAGPATKLDERIAPAVMARLPLAFETNRGQAPDGWDFLVRCRGYHAFVRSSGIVFSFDGAPLAMSIDGADRRAPATDGLALAGRANYFIGDDPSKWITEVPLVRGARYEDVAPATSWGVGGRGRALEFAFDLAPGADAPRLRFDGARGVRVADDGSLRVAMPTGEATISAPLAWQGAGAGRVDARAKFVVEKDGAVRVATSPRDPDRGVVIDPTVTYESYLGGATSDQCTGAAVDASGAPYFCGYTDSSAFPTTSGAYAVAIKNTSGGSPSVDVFVTKVAASGSSLVYSTYIGGSSTDYSAGFFVDSSGSAFVAASSASNDYPVTAGVVRPLPPGGGSQGCLTQLAPSGASIVFSTYTMNSGPTSIAPGPSGATYVLDGQGLGLYSSGATSQVFYKQLKPTSTYYAQNMGFGGVASDANGDAYVAGGGDMQNYVATAGAYQTSIAGQKDAFVTKIRSDGTIVFTTYFGGAANDGASAIDVNQAGQPYIAGTTSSTNLPVTSGAFRTTISSANSDAFVARLGADGSSLRYSTYLGAGVARGVRAHAGSSFVVAGYTTYSTFPVSNAFQSTFGGVEDGFVMKFNRDGSLAWSSYCGGSAQDDVNALGMGPDGSVACAGITFSGDLPLTNAVQSTRSGTYDALLLKIPDNLPTVIAPVAVTTSAAPTWTVGFPYDPFQLTATGGVGPYAWTLVSGSLPDTMSFGTDGVVTGTPPQVGVYSFTVRADDPTDLFATRLITLKVNPYPSISPPAMTGATIDTPYDRMVPVVDGSGTMTFALLSGSPPQGLALGSDGHVTGTPTQLGDSSFTVGVTDGRGATGSGLVTLHVGPLPVMSATPTPDWTATRAYTVQFAANGGTAPLVWSVPSGALPAPTFDSATGKLSGAAKAAGPYAFTLRVTDANGAKSERAFALAINAMPTVADAVAPHLAVGRPCSVKPVRTGGTAPFQWTATLGAVPPGVAVDPSTGGFVGVPTSETSGEVQIECRDAAGAVGSGRFVLTSATPVDLVHKHAAETVVLTMQSPPTVERFFELTADARLGVVVTGGGSAAGGPRMHLYDASGAELDVSASTKSTAKSVALRKFVVPATGRYFLTVQPAVGSLGKMRIATTIAPPATWTSAGDVGPSAQSEYDFSAPPGSFLSISAKSANASLALPRIESILAPDGTDLLPGGKSLEKAKSASFSLSTPLAGGDYRVVFGPRDVNAGSITWSVKLRMPGKYTFALPDLAAGM